MRTRTLQFLATFGPAFGAVALCGACVTAGSKLPPGPNKPIPGKDAPALDRATQARQALNRLTFGARPGDVEIVEKMGVEQWIDLQLHPERIPDAKADQLLDLLETQRKQPFELIADHPNPEELAPRLKPRIGVDNAPAAPDAADTLRYRRSQLTVNALVAQAPVSKLLRAMQSDRQLLEVMVDFWENHFSVSIAKSPNRYSMVQYDRDVIRPHALGKFRDLLGAVAKSPQMLYYLDQWQSNVDSLHPTIPEARIAARRASMATPPMGDSGLLTIVNHRRSVLNENYARELMELHTLGVNGGYAQHDVVEVARCLTGWTIDRPELGGTFLFRQDAHDAGEKTVLGTRIPAGGGVDDGERVLDMLAKHPSTAHYIARKLAIRFVSDTPPAALVERAAQTFLNTDGDIREVMRTLVTSPEFFSEAAFRAKVKTPFELVASTLRALDAAPDTTPRSVQVVARLGQPTWQHLTPDGWPEYGEAWMNAGALLNRVNFGVQVANGGMPGVSVAKWSEAPRIVTLPAAAQVQAVIDDLLSGRASPQTRDAMMAAATSTDAQQPIKRLGELVAIAIGSPEFQRR